MNLLTSLVFITLVLNRSTTGESSHVLEGKLPSKTILEGDNFYDVCPSPGYPPDKVYWENEARTFHSGGKELSIMNISRAMSGTYTCYGLNDSVPLSLESFFIDVQYPAKILFWNDSKNDIYANDSFVSVAGVEGNPSPSIDLISSKTQKEIIFIQHGEGIINLTISQLQCEDIGMYELHCSNTYNSVAMSKYVYVYCPPYVRPGANITFTIRPRLGESARLTMSAAGYPLPLFTWTHEAKEIKHKDNNYTSTIIINVENVEEFGEYHLTMRNSVGSAQFTFHLIPSGPPERPKEFKLVTCSDNSATLSWMSGYDYNSTQTFVVMNIKGGERTEMQTFDGNSTDIGGNEVTGTIRNLNPNSIYNLTLKAVNIEGESESDLFVYFVTEDKVHTFSVISMVGGVFVGLFIAFIGLIFCRIYHIRRSRSLSLRAFSNYY